MTQNLTSTNPCHPGISRQGGVDVVSGLWLESGAQESHDNRQLENLPPEGEQPITRIEQFLLPGEALNSASSF
jgi:hypothetical protein